MDKAYGFSEKGFEAWKAAGREAKQDLKDRVLGGYSRVLIPILNPDIKNLITPMLGYYDTPDIDWESLRYENSSLTVVVKKNKKRVRMRLGRALYILHPPVNRRSLDDQELAFFSLNGLDKGNFVNIDAAFCELLIRNMESKVVFISAKHQDFLRAGESENYFCTCYAVDRDKQPFGLSIEYQSPCSLVAYVTKDNKPNSKMIGRCWVWVDFQQDLILTGRIYGTMGVLQAKAAVHAVAERLGGDWNFGNFREVYADRKTDWYDLDEIYFDPHEGKPSAYYCGYKRLEDLYIDFWCLYSDLVCAKCGEKKHPTVHEGYGWICDECTNDDAANSNPCISCGFDLSDTRSHMGLISTRYDQVICLACYRKQTGTFSWEGISRIHSSQDPLNYYLVENHVNVEIINVCDVCGITHNYKYDGVKKVTTCSLCADNHTACLNCGFIYSKIYHSTCPHCAESGICAGCGKQVRFEELKNYEIPVANGYDNELRCRDCIGIT